MAWFAVVEDATGRLLSWGEVLGTLSAGISALPIAGHPGEMVWDTVTRTFQPRPAPIIRDRIAELLADARVQLLPAAVQTTVQAVVMTYFSSVRHEP